MEKYEIPNSMKAAYLTERPADLESSIKALQLGDLPVPTLEKGQVLIKVKAFAVNNDDMHMAMGLFLGGIAPQAPAGTVDKPLGVGSDYAGVIAALGPECTAGFKVGDEVIGVNATAIGDAPAWAEYTVANENKIARKHRDISFVEQASLVMPTYVSTNMLVKSGFYDDNNDNGSPLSCLVIGASGGIGSLLVQLLKNSTKRKVHIVGVCSGRNEEFVKELGATDVIDYTKGAFDDQILKAYESGAIPPLDYVFDCVGGTHNHRAAKRILGHKRSSSGKRVKGNRYISYE